MNEEEFKHRMFVIKQFEQSLNRDWILLSMSVISFVVAAAALVRTL